MKRTFTQRIYIFVLSFILIAVMGIIVGALLSDIYYGFWISAIVVWGSMIYIFSAENPDQTQPPAQDERVHQ